jgi:hypothetical protein
MGISAIALLRLRTLSPQADETLPAKALDDAILLDTRASFASEPAELSRIVRAQLGDARLAEHFDSRGIFFIPDVASPSARTYAGVIEEVAEGGVWGPLRSDDSPLGAGSAAGLGALLGGLLEQMPPSLLQSVGDAARGQPGALEAASAQLRTALSGSSELSGLVAQLAGAFDPHASAAAEGFDPAAVAGLGSSGSRLPDLSDLTSALGGTGMNMESMQQLASRMQAALAADPSATAAMVEQLFGDRGQAAGDDWSDDDPTLPAPTKPR